MMLQFVILLELAAFSGLYNENHDFDIYFHTYQR